MRNYLFLLAIFFAVQAKPQTTFQKIYKNLNYSEYGNDYCIAADGNYMIAAQHSDGTNSIASLMKVDALGSILWRKNFPDLVRFFSITQTLDGGYALSGFSNFDMCILKTDSSGNVQWCKLFGLSNSTDYPLELIQNPNGEFFLVGQGTDDLTSDMHAFILKTDSTGTLIWDKIITTGSFAPVYASHCSFTNDDGIIVTGSYTINSVVKLLMMKIDSSGNTMWTRCYGNNFFGQASFQTDDGGYISSGSGRSASINYGFVLIKTDSVGNLQWSKVYSDALVSHDLLIDPDGNFVLAGTYENTSDDSASIYLLKTDQQGDTIWTRFYETNSQLGYRGEYENSILQTPDGGFLLGGQADINHSAYTDIYLLKTDADGNTGCNLVQRPITIESITPTFDTTVIVTSGVLTASIIPASSISQITDTTLCLHDWINEYENIISLDVYPNPATDQITINTSAFSESELLLEVKDIMGRNVIQRKVYPGNLQLDVSNISRGVYLIVLRGKKSCGRSIFFKQ
jgi:hypothetical protein